MNETVFILSEEKYFDYLEKTEGQEKALKHCLFEDTFFHENEEIIVLLCEYVSSLHQMKRLLEDVEDQYDKKDKCFYLTEIQALKFSVFLESAVSTKELLSKKNVSLSSH